MSDFYFPITTAYPELRLFSSDCATINFPLAQLYTLIAGENLTGKMMLETRILLLRNKQRVTWGELLTARTRMAFHYLELEK